MHTNNKLMINLQIFRFKKLHLHPLSWVSKIFAQFEEILSEVYQNLSHLTWILFKQSCTPTELSKVKVLRLHPNYLDDTFTKSSRTLQANASFTRIESTFKSNDRHTSFDIFSRYFKSFI
mmetsp:Transcript_15186/g.19824  ORF Transcript_15186/g.19824 Transcript_15186/m.19824 type:complete len:120 (-) Transcript_15186:344-703(-)